MTLSSMLIMSQSFFRLIFFFRIQARYLVDGLVSNLCLIISLWLFNLIFCQCIFCGLKTGFSGLAICKLSVSYYSTVGGTLGLLIKGTRFESDNMISMSLHFLFLTLHWLGSSKSLGAHFPCIFISCCDKEESQQLSAMC